MSTEDLQKLPLFRLGYDEYRAEVKRRLDLEGRDQTPLGEFAASLPPMQWRPLLALRDRLSRSPNGHRHRWSEFSPLRRQRV
ncbi:MAG TPA: hypothetical protein VFD48_13520 [Pyrinomonadaceae bacterium]|nr:hypothetical protein [Pyrinomonadaceae bacterium]